MSLSSNKPPEFKTKIIGAFNVDNSDVHFTPKFRYVYKKYSEEGPVDFNLNQGDNEIEDCWSNISQEKKIDYLLEYRMRSDFQTRFCKYCKPFCNKDCKPDFVCSRRTLCNIMCAPYENYYPLTILATKFKGTIYLCTQIPADIKSKNVNQKSLKFGLKFEQYITSG